MTSRERVIAALDHRMSDKVPVDFSGTPVTGIHVSVVEAMRKEYGLESHPVRVWEPYQMLGEVEPDLMEVLGVDIAPVPAYKTMFGYTIADFKPWTTPWGQKVMVPGDFNFVVDSEGDTLVYPEGDRTAAPSGRMPKTGYFFDGIVRQKPLPESDADLNPEDNLEEFGLLGADALAYFKRACGDARRSGRAVVANAGGTGLGDIALVPGPFMKDPKGIRDIQEWYISTLTRQDYLHRVFEKQTDISLKNLEAVKKATGDDIDVIFLDGTDFGTQTSQFCSPETFRTLYMPYYKRMTNWICANTSWKCFKHSCGAVFPLIELFLESGFDILNPVQFSATGMDSAELKRRFGDRITFWGGGVDTQLVLPFGTPGEVRAQVRRQLELFSPGGGFVFNAVHNVQAGTPIANVVAMIEAVREFNGEG